jgi:hypothetical protein
MGCPLLQVKAGEFKFLIQRKARFVQGDICVGGKWHG